MKRSTKNLTLNFEEIGQFTSILFIDDARDNFDFKLLLKLANQPKTPQL
jgi:hypothetical protein